MGEIVRKRARRESACHPIWMRHFDSWKDFLLYMNVIDSKLTSFFCASSSSFHFRLSLEGDERGCF